MASRDIKTLAPSMQAKAGRFLVMCKEAGFDVLIYCTLRSLDEQAILYRQSRTLSQIKNKARELADTYGRADLAKILYDVGPQSGPHVTNAAPGQSLHNYGYAFDGVPLVGGKPTWNSSAPQWEIYGDLADMAGLDWAGHWISFKEYPHCQQSGVKWQDLIGGRT